MRASTMLGAFLCWVVRSRPWPSAALAQRAQDETQKGEIIMNTTPFSLFSILFCSLVTCVHGVIIHLSVYKGVVNAHGRRAHAVIKSKEQTDPWQHC